MPTAITKPKPGSGTGSKPSLIERNLQRLGIKYRKITPVEKQILIAHEAKKRAYRGIKVEPLKRLGLRYQQGNRERRLPKNIKTKTPRRGSRRVPKRIKYPRWWRDLRVTGFNLSGLGFKKVFSTKAGERSFVNAIAFTVSGETSITLEFGDYGSSGPMAFGGEGQAMGISIPMGDAPAPCGGGGFSISSTNPSASVAGFVVYYSEPDEPPEIAK